MHPPPLMTLAARYACSNNRYVTMLRGPRVGGGGGGSNTLSAIMTVCLDSPVSETSVVMCSARLPSFSIVKSSTRPTMCGNDEMMCDVVCAGVRAPDDDVGMVR